MKNNHILTLCIAALIGAGCSDDQIINDSPLGGETEARTLRIGAGFAKGSATRLGYDETDDAINLTWTADDMLQLYSTNNGTYTTPCVLVEGAGTTSAQFELVDYMSYTQGETLYALYCKGNLPVVDADGDLTVSVEGQTGQLDERFQLMWGTTTYKEGTNPYFEMKHLTSIVKVTIPSEKSLQSVTLRGNEISSKGTLVFGTLPNDALNVSNINPGDVLYSQEKGNQGMYETFSRDQLTVTGPFEPENGVVTVYFYVLPVKSYFSGWPETTITKIQPSVCAVNVDGETLVSVNTFSKHEIKAGKVYELHPSMCTLSNFQNEGEADGSESQPYELWTENDLYNWMWRTRENLRNRDYLYYKECHYKLMSNITLNNLWPWTPADIRGGFDGNGKTISGCITSASRGSVWFGAIEDATVKDLTLALNSVSFSTTMSTTDRQEYFGVLCESCTIANLVHIINRTNVNPDAYRIGGLAGRIDGSATMIACGNEGNITSASEVCNMGGLVGLINGSNTIEACYNTGNLTASYPSSEGSYVGGLVGCDASTSINLNACWTSESLNVIGIGSFTNCISVATGATPSEEQIAEMNSAMQNGVWTFNTEGRPVKDESGADKENSATIPDIPEVEW